MGCWFNEIVAFFVVFDRADLDLVNDRVILTLDRYLTGEISLQETLGLLEFVTPNIQYCVRSEEMLRRCLTYIKSERLWPMQASKFWKVQNVLELLLVLAICSMYLCRKGHLLWVWNSWFDRWWSCWSPLSQWQILSYRSLGWIYRKE